MITKHYIAQMGALYVIIEAKRYKEVHNDKIQEKDFNITCGNSGIAYRIFRDGVCEHLVHGGEGGQHVEDRGTV